MTTRELLARRDVVGPAAVLFAIMVAHTLLETARDALFLARLGPDSLAWVYFAMAGIALLAFAAVRRFGGVRDPRRVLIVFLGVAVAGTAVFAATIAVSRSVVFAFYVWTGLVATLVVPCFWTVLDRSLRVGEAKRVFAVIGAGGVLGAMVGSAAASALGRVLAASDLVTAGAVAYAGAAGCALVLAPQPTLVDPPPRRQHAEALTRRSRRYVELLIVLGVVSTIALTLGDLVFKRTIAARLPADDLATAFGAIYTGLNTLGLVIQLVVAPRLFAKWGVGAALTVLPVILVATGFGFALTGAVIAVVALKLGDGGMRHSLHRVGKELLYLPVPASIRDGWKPVADAIDLRGGEALAALIAFAVGAAGIGLRGLAAVAATVATVWFVGLGFVRRAYLAQFRDTLRAGEVARGGRIPELDGDAVELLADALASPDEPEALAALDLLADRGRLPALVLYHPRVSVVRRALALLEGELRPDIARVLGHLLDHADPSVRAAALAASSRTGSHRERLIAALTDVDAGVRAAALVGLADDPERGPGAQDGIAKLVIGSLDDRVALARAIEYAPGVRPREVLYELLAWREPAVLRHVVRVLARDHTDADLDHLLELLAHPYVRGDVRRAFLAAGPRGLDRLLDALDDPRTTLGVRRHLPRTIMRFGSRRAATALVARLLREPDGTTEFKILRALGRMRAADPELRIDIGAIREYARRAVADAARYTTLVDRMTAEPDASPASTLILELLRDKRGSAIEHAFRALGILHPRAGLRSAHDALVAGDEARASAAREILEVLLPTELRVPLLAVLDPLSPAERRTRLGALAAGPFATYEILLAALLADPSESVRCVVAYHVAERRLVTLRKDLVRLRPTVGPPLVTHAFDQAIARLDV